MASRCNCIGFGFSSINCTSDISPFIISGYRNGRLYYVGTFTNILNFGNPEPSVECIVYWDSTQWVIEQTDPSFPEILWFSTVNSQGICDLTSSDWQSGDFTNFPCNSLSLDVQSIDCPTLDCKCFQSIGSPFCNSVTYLDCNYNEVTLPTIAGEKYKFCTGNVAYFFDCSSFPPLLEYLGECVDGECPEPTTTTTTFFPVTTTTTTFFPNPNTPLEPTNECDVITIFPMGVECVSIDPSFSDTYDGSASLYITGGTPPYEILWENGSVGPTINNLGIGEYKATVTDSYGDFLITSTCVLSAETPSPTTTTTSTIPPPQFGDLCMVIKDNSSRVGLNKLIDFIYDGYFNSKPSWLSNDNQYFMYWNTGTTGEWLVSGITSGVIYNPNPSTPPLVGWNYLGIGNAVTQVFEGSCSLIPPLSMSISKNDPTCTNNGSIIVTPYGGIPPYMYSKDGGLLFQSNPIFNNLGGGNYSIVTKDSIGSQQTQVVTLTSSSSPAAYNIILNRNGNNLSVNITPSLPNGISISFDLIVKSKFSVTPSQTSATNSSGANILVNSSPVASNSPIISNTSNTILCDNVTITEYKTNKTLVWSNITLNNTSTFSGTLFNIVTPVLPSPSCYSVNSSITAYIDNAKMQGCECCNVIVVQEAVGLGFSKA